MVDLRLNVKTPGCELPGTPGPRASSSVTGTVPTRRVLLGQPLGPPCGPQKQLCCSSLPTSEILILPKLRIELPRRDRLTEVRACGVAGHSQAGGEALEEGPSGDTGPAAPRGLSLPCGVPARSPHTFSAGRSSQTRHPDRQGSGEAVGAPGAWQGVSSAEEMSH